MASTVEKVALVLRCEKIQYLTLLQKLEKTDLKKGEKCNQANV